ncbi:MAG: trk system potassium uptake protein TrkH, partial [Natronomonas sp.]
QWDGPAKALLLFTMFIGGSAGSTGGGIKVVRWIIVLKAARREVLTASRPDVVQPIRLGGNVVDEESVKGVLAFTILYIALFGVSTVFFVLDGLRVGYELSVLEAMSASLATLGNIGPGFGSLGPFGSYLDFPAETKLVMVFLMWIGRLEIIPVLAVFTGAFWKR